MPLTEKQKKLYLDLHNAINKKEDITDLLKQVGRNDFTDVFAARGIKIKFINEEKTEFINLIEYAAVINNAEALKAICNYCKKNGISVMNVLKAIKSDVDLSSSMEFCEVQIGINEIHLVILNQLKEFFSADTKFPFCKSLPTAYYEAYFECWNECKGKKIDMGLLVNKLSDKGMLKKFISIPKGDELEQLKDELKSSGNDDALEKIYQAEKEIAANKAVVAGAICGVIAGLAVGGGCFAAGVALPILTMIGIAVAAAVLTGLVAGGITYVISSKIENPDTSRVEKKQGFPQPN